MAAHESLLPRFCLPLVGTEALACACKTRPKLKKLKCVGYQLVFNNTTSLKQIKRVASS